MQVSVNGQDFSRSAAQFWYNDDVSVTHVSPTNGPPTGGTVLVVTGDGFYDSAKLKCAFSSTTSGNTLATVVATFLSDTQVQCIVPVIETAVSVKVSVTTNGLRFSNTSVLYDLQYSNHIKIVAINELFRQSNNSACDRHISAHITQFDLFI